MPIEYNVTAMDRFRDVDFGKNEKKTVFMGSGNTVEAGDEYGGMFTAIGRSDTEKKTNNEVRTELLKTLGNLFGLKGMNEENGKVTFTKAFMDELERIIGSKEFKRDDFDIKNGVVSSGRPLTMRRVTAILDKAEIYGAAAKKTGDVTGLPDKPKELYVGYAKKLEELKADLGLAGLTPKQLREKLEQQPELKIFVRMEKSLDYLMNELDLEREAGEDDASALRPTLGFDNHVNYYNHDPETFKGTRFEFKDPTTGKYRSIESDKDFKDLKDLLWHRLGGTLIHTEYFRIDPRNDTSIEPLKKYIVNTIKMFVMRGLDTYFEAKKQGKVDLYMQHIKEPGACMEDLGMKFQLFEEKNLIDAKPMDKEEAAELKRIANEPTKSEAPRRADQIICDTLTTLPGYEEKDEWDDELATALKAKLIGKSCQMIELEKAGNGTKFKPIVKQGKPVIKQLTAKDLDILGPACFKNLNGF